MWISIIAATLFVIAGPASATLVAVGDPFDIGSWGHAFYEAGSNFNHVQLQMATEGDFFESISGFENEDLSANGDWHGHTDSPDNPNNHVLLWADGPSLDWLEFVVAFAGDSHNEMTFHYQAYNDEHLVTNVDASWTPPYPAHGLSAWHWEFDEGTWEEVQPIPEPIGMAMLGCVGAGMLVARKLRGKRAT